MKPRKIVIVDGYPILREAFASLINAESDLEVCAQADSAAGALSHIAAVKPHLVILEIAWFGFNGLDLIRQIKSLAPDVAVLALSSEDELVYAERTLRAGAAGYVMKQAPRDIVMDAIRKVATGGRYLSPRMQERMMEHFANGSRKNSPGLDRLTDRELEVFKMFLCHNLIFIFHQIRHHAGITRYKHGNIPPGYRHQYIAHFFTRHVRVIFIALFDRPAKADVPDKQEDDYYGEGGG
jgi:DNA-binding NarL/FixJ family response regulator